MSRSRSAAIPAPANTAARTHQRPPGTSGPPGGAINQPALQPASACPMGDGIVTYRVTPLMNTAYIDPERGGRNRQHRGREAKVSDVSNMLWILYISTRHARIFA